VRSLRRPFTALVALCLLAAPGHAQDRTDVLLGRLAALPHATHNSEIRVDPVVGSHAVRVWINSNEDDTRLYTPAGGQMDADFQLAAIVQPGEWPDSVSLLIETRGPVHAGPGPPALILRAGGRPVQLTQREHPPARSGPLLFLSMQADLPFVEFLALVTSPGVDGRVWDVPFRLMTSQLELLRAWTLRVAAAADGR
jgi:hypothetical protein